MNILYLNIKKKKCGQNRVCQDRGHISARQRFETHWLHRKRMVAV